MTQTGDDFKAKPSQSGEPRKERYPRGIRRPTPDEDRLVRTRAADVLRGLADLEGAAALSVLSFALMTAAHSVYPWTSSEDLAAINDRMFRATCGMAPMPEAEDLPQ